ncbi:MAG TPA: chemotaxis response regulator protein-glutamate methylesterase [Bryobacteraceae bacterium]|nr:chemotaxis response regulator protein-glutamate methylesterase [Bryobacteraceae bacterium]
MPTGRKIRVLIVDDSAIVRKALSEIVSSHADLEVAGTASDPFVARDKILSLKPDVLTLDIEMPRMDGLTFLKKLMKYHPLPVVMISSLAQSSSRIAIEALQSGAVEVVAKPGGPYSVTDLRTELAHKIRAAAQARLRQAQASAIETPVAPAPAAATGLIAIGSSTGGVEALWTILTNLPPEMPPIVIAQHIPAVFSAEFANRLNKASKIRVKEAADGDAIPPGWALIAPGNFHLTVRKAARGWHAVVAGGELVQYQRPSVDVLFESVAKQAAGDAVGVILTGMGADGAAGLLAMKQTGAHTIAQDEASSVVFGMPREAIRLGAVNDILSLNRIAHALARYATVPAGAV